MEAEFCMVPTVLTYQMESSDVVARDIVPLMHAHNADLGDDFTAKFPLDVDMDFYHHVYKAGVLKIFTARHGLALAGYATFLVHPSIHRRSMVVAHEDALYLRPEFRRGRNARRLMDFAEEELRKTCAAVIYHCPESSPAFGKLLGVSGYEKYATYFVRRF